MMDQKKKKKKNLLSSGVVPLFQVRLGRHSIRPPLRVLCADGFYSAVMIQGKKIAGASQEERQTGRSQGVSSFHVVVLII